MFNIIKGLDYLGFKQKHFSNIPRVLKHVHVEDESIIPRFTKEFNGKTFIELEGGVLLVYDDLKGYCVASEKEWKTYFSCVR